MADSVYELEKIEDDDMDLASRFGKDTSHDRLRPTGAESSLEVVPAPTPERAAVKTVENRSERSGSEKDSAYSRILQKVKKQPVQPKPSDDISQDASDLDRAHDRDSQLTHLLDLAKVKGVNHAVKVAEHAEDYFVLDQLHDKLLSDDFHDALVSAGLIHE